MSSKEERIASYITRIARKHDVNQFLRTNVGVAGPESSDRASRQFVEIHASATAGLQEILNGRVPSPQQSAGIDAIILPKIRPVLDVIGGDFHTDHPLWQKLNDDQAIRGRLLKAISSIGRVELPGNRDYPYGGTGFVVGEGIIMTNTHVAEIFSSGIGTRQLAFKPGLCAGVDFLHELDGPAGTTLMVKQTVLIHPYWDMALLAVEDLPVSAAPLSLSLHDVPADPMIESRRSGIRLSTTEMTQVSRTICFETSSGSNGCSQAHWADDRTRTASARWFRAET